VGLYGVTDHGEGTMLEDLKEEKRKRELGAGSDFAAFKIFPKLFQALK